MKMKPLFTISRLGAQNKVPDVNTIIHHSDLVNICQRLTDQNEFDVVWIEERIKGKMFTLETDDCKFYITYTPNVVGGRNSYLQSVPTAFGIYLNESIQNGKKCQFCLYFTPFRGENQTRYHQFMYKLLSSMGVLFVNADEGLRGLTVKDYSSVCELIADRDSNSSRNSSNKSSYITDEGLFYHVYGKTFGANQKETTMLCLALCRISDKPIRLFQISDNDSEYLSDADIEAIKLYARNFGKVQIDVLDDTYEFNDDYEQQCNQTSAEESLRSPRFIFNLLEKTGGHKCCSLCHCEIESIIQGAHIYPVQAIKRRDDLPFDVRLEMATDKDNGIWLCENHHKLFDRGLIRFENGNLQIMPKLSEIDAAFVNDISPYKIIDKQYFTTKMSAYFDKRDEFYRAEGYY